MENILILTDFSVNAYNAARYALKLAEELKIHHVTVYHSFAHVTVDADGFINNGQDFELYLKESEYRLQNMKEFLKPNFFEGLTITFKTDQRPLAYAVDDICAEEHIDLIVAGSKVQTSTGHFLFGSSVSTLIKSISLPLLVVPLHANYKKPEIAVLATDFEEISKTNVQLIHSFANSLHLRLEIANVSSRDEHVDLLSIHKQKELYDHLADLNPEYHYLNDSNVTGALYEFVSNANADLAIMIHRKHNFLQSILKGSTSDKLAISLKVPMLIFKENV